MTKTEAISMMGEAIAISLDGMPTDQLTMVLTGIEMPLTIGAQALVDAGVLTAD